MPTEHASIAWERVYNTFSFRQIMEYTFDVKKYYRLYEFSYKNKTYVADLLRSRIVYPNKEVAIKDIKDHIQESKRVLTNAKLLIFTLGLIEIFDYVKD